jgi:hypothetical protein
MDTFHYYFNIAFPIKESIVNKWITKGTIVSRNRLRLLCDIKRSTNLPTESLKFIQNYQLIYRKVIKEAKILSIKIKTQLSGK